MQLVSNEVGNQQVSYPIHTSTWISRLLITRQQRPLSLPYRYSLGKDNCCRLPWRLITFITVGINEGSVFVGVANKDTEDILL